MAAVGEGKPIRAETDFQFSCRQINRLNWKANSPIRVIWEFGEADV